MTKTQNPRYHVGQQVEVQKVDFKVAGFPTVWMHGEVTEVVAADNGLWNVHVKVTSGGWSPQIVGKRGGNKNIREATVCN